MMISSFPSPKTFRIRLANIETTNGGLKKKVELKTPKNDNTDYLDLIDSIDAFRVMIPDESPPGRQLMVRHDVDHNIDQALDMARYEEKNGIRATYFLLHSAPYFDTLSGEFLAKCRELRNLGHSLGFHNNMLAEYIRSDGTINVYREIMGICSTFMSLGVELVGTSAHGDNLCSKRGFLNYELWEECPDEKRLLRSEGGFFPRPIFSLREFNFQYEAYFLQRDAYLSDTGHTWYGATGDGIGNFEIPHDNIGKDGVIEAFNNMDSGVMQINVHPCWWAWN